MLGCSFFSAFILLASTIPGTASALPITSTASATSSPGTGGSVWDASSLGLDGGISVENVIGAFATQVGASSYSQIDAGSPSEASFSRRLNASPTTTAVYSLDLDDLEPVRGASDDRTNAAWTAWLKRRIRRFPGTAVPEPSAAILFGVGLVVAHASLRRRHWAKFICPDSRPTRRSSRS